MLNVMVSKPALAFASVIAWRSDPAPESAVLVTVKVAAETLVASVLANASKIRRMFIVVCIRGLRGVIHGSPILREASFSVLQRRPLRVRNGRMKKGRRSLGAWRT